MIPSIKQLLGEKAAPEIIAVCAVVRNEAPYLLEWIAAHRVVGIRTFFLANNESDDGTAELLDALAALGIVETFNFATRDDTPTQLAAYAEIASKFGQRAEWLAFIDADEVIVPEDASFSFERYLAEVDPTIGSIGLNWAIFGSAGRLVPGDGTILDRFDRRAPDTSTVNHHYKSIVRTRALRSVGPNPHAFLLRRGYSTAHADGYSIEDHKTRGIGLSEEVRWTPVRINHYVVKSLAEFDHKKAPRGRAMHTMLKRDRRFFRAHDRNEILDPAPDWLRLAAKAEIKAIKALLATAGFEPWVVNSDESIRGIEPADPRPAPPQGAVDGVSLRAEHLVLHGWALDEDLRRPSRFVLHMDGEPVASFKGRRYSRPDVTAKLEQADENCGFKVKLPLNKLPINLVTAGSERSIDLRRLSTWADGRFVLDMPSAEIGDRVRGGLGKNDGQTNASG